MKLIIDIPEETFTCLKNMIEAECVDPYSLADIIVNKGTPVSTEGDLISREALKKAIKSYADDQYAENEYLGECAIMAIIDNTPTVEPYKAIEILDLMYEKPQDGWIPVSEILPQDRDWYLGVFKEPDTGFIGIPYICDYVGEITKGTTKEGWILRGLTDTDNANEYYKSLECVAWQPVPEPYQKGGTE